MSIALRSALTSAVNSVTERVPGSASLPKKALLVWFGLFDDLGDVAGVVAERAVGAGVEAALDAEHDQDQDDQAAAEREPAPQHDLLAFGAALRPLATSRPACWRILQEAALQAGWVAGEYEAWRGRRVKSSQQTVRFSQAPRRRREAAPGAKLKELWSVPSCSTAS